LRKVVFIGVNFPEKHATAAGWRIHQIIDVMKKANDEIYFLATNEIKSEKDFENIKCINIQLNSDSFDVLLKDINPKLVIFDRFITEEQYGWRVSAQCPDAIKILDTEDLHFLRKKREDLFLKSEISEKTKDVFKREIASILRCDLSLIISRYEYELLINKYKIDNSQLFYLPFLFDEKIIANKKDFSDRENFMFIGNFLHEPNWQTVLILKKIWSGIKRKLPQVELHIYGAYMPDKAMQLQDEKMGFLMKGQAIDIEKLFETYRLMLAPIPYGAGLKGKLFESMIYGLPNITTPIGAEGLYFNDLWHGFISDSNEDFIDKSILLYQDEKLWYNKQKDGIDILKENFSISKYISIFLDRISEIGNDVKGHRSSNYLIEVLQHQTLQSTKYLSKWIAEKAKNKN
jgi:glycosyltransferase involved in cell wall biosynthesis